MFRLIFQFLESFISGFVFRLFSKSCFALFISGMFLFIIIFKTDSGISNRFWNFGNRRSAFENNIDFGFWFSKMCFLFLVSESCALISFSDFVLLENRIPKIAILFFWFRKSLYFVFGIGFRKSIFRFWIQKILDFVFRKSCLGFWFHCFLYKLFLQVDSEFWKRLSHKSFSSFV